MENVKNHDSDRIEFPEQKIIDVDMKKEVERSFIEYSMSVIASRALPDVRDGMKPGQRRILYAMYEDHLTSDKPFRKSATTVTRRRVFQRSPTSLCATLTRTSL